MKLSHSGLTAIAAVLLSAAGPGHATSVATGTLSDFRITLLDLAPDDGAAPALELDPLSRSTALAGAVSPGASTFWMQQGDAAFAPVASSGQMDGTGGAASFAGDPFGAAGATFAVSAVGRPGFAGGTGETYVDTQPSGLTQFTLGAHTQVTFSGLASLGWNASAGAASAHGSVGLDFWQMVDSGEIDVARDDLADGYFGDGAGALAGAASRQLTITFANDSDATVLLGYAVDVFADASEVAVPVDEPAGAALLLAAAAPLAWLARRRRR